MTGAVTVAVYFVIMPSVGINTLSLVSVVIPISNATELAEQSMSPAAEALLQ